MADPLVGRLLEYLQAHPDRPLRSRALAKQLGQADDESYSAFRLLLQGLKKAGQVAKGHKGTVVLSKSKPSTSKPSPASPKSAVKPKTASRAKPASKRAPRSKPGVKAVEPVEVAAPELPVEAVESTPIVPPVQSAPPVPAAPVTPAVELPRAGPDEVIGTFRLNRKGFGFVIPLDPTQTDDLYIGERDNPPGAITGDVVRAKIVSRNKRDGKVMLNGRIIDVLERKQTRFVGSLIKRVGQWCVMPDGNALIEPIFTPDAATKYLPEGTKVVVEITEFASGDMAATGVISDVLGQAGEKDVDLRTVVIQHNLPGEFPQEVKDQASEALAAFKATKDFGNRYDLRDDIVCTIDPDDAKDYDDAISLKRVDDGWELGVHIADVSHFVPKGSALDLEAYERGNSTYFPGHVIPMLPEVLSNGICSLMEGVPRLCKSAFIVIGDDAKPVRTRFSNSIIHSNKRLRYTEAQAIIDMAGHQEAVESDEAVIPHPDGKKKLSEYDPNVVQLLLDMNALAKRIQKRRRAAGQLNLDLPKMELVLDANGKVIDAVPEDDAFTHTLIEMFMVEANEAVARLLDSLNVPFLRRTHPDPDEKRSVALKHFAGVLGYPLPDTVDRHALQALLAKTKGRPEAFAINMAVLRSLSRAEYSPKPIGHFALASTHYGHFTSPIRRYADLTIHRLMDAFFAAINADFSDGPVPKPKGRKIVLEDVPTLDQTVQTGRHISHTERRSEDAERELRMVKLLELMQNHVGEKFPGVVAGITNFGIFVQLQAYTVEGLIRYTELLDDWWEVDEKSGIIRGQRSRQTIRIGDVCTVTIAAVDLPRREMTLRMEEVLSRGKNSDKTMKPEKDRPEARGRPQFVEGKTKRSQRSKSKGSGKNKRRDR